MPIRFFLKNNLIKANSLRQEGLARLRDLKLSMSFQKLNQLAKTTTYPDGSMITCVSCYNHDSIYISAPIRIIEDKPKIIKRKFILKRPLFLVGYGNYEVPSDITTGGLYGYDVERFNPTHLMLWDPMIESEFSPRKKRTIFTNLTPKEVLEQYEINLFHTVSFEEYSSEVPWGMTPDFERNKKDSEGYNSPIVRWLSKSDNYLDDIYRFNYSYGEEYNVIDSSSIYVLPGPVGQTSETPRCWGTPTYASAELETHLDNHSAYEERTIHSCATLPPEDEDGWYGFLNADDLKTKIGRCIGSTSLIGYFPPELNSSTIGWVETFEQKYTYVDYLQPYGGDPEDFFQQYNFNDYRKYNISSCWESSIGMKLTINKGTHFIGEPENDYGVPQDLGKANGGSITLTLGKCDAGHIALGFLISGTMKDSYPILSVNTSGVIPDYANPYESESIRVIQAKWDLFKGADDTLGGVNFFELTKDDGFSSAVTKLVDDCYTNFYNSSNLYIANSVIEGRVILENVEVIEYEDNTYSTRVYGYGPPEKNFWENYLLSLRE